MAAEAVAETLRVISTPAVHTEWGWVLGTEFFLNAVATGAFAVSAGAVLRLARQPEAARGEALGSAARIGAWLGLVLIVVAPALLMLDLGQPLRFWHLYVMVNLRSPISWGTFFLSAFPVLAALHLGLLLAGRLRGAVVTALLGLPLALLTQGYTAFVVHLGRGRPLWDSVLLPPLFVVSAVAAGSAAVLVGLLLRARGARREDPELRSVVLGLIRLLGGALGIVLLSLVALGLGLALGSERQQAALQVLLTGLHGWASLGLVLGLGTVIPLLLLGSTRRQGHPPRVLAASALALLGGLALRLTFLVSGQALPLF